MRNQYGHKVNQVTCTILRLKTAQRVGFQRVTLASLQWMLNASPAIVIDVSGRGVHQRIVRRDSVGLGPVLLGRHDENEVAVKVAKSRKVVPTPPEIDIAFRCAHLGDMAVCMKKL